MDSQPLSILHVHTLPVVSGSGINTLLTMRGSRDHGHEVALACASMGRLTDETQKARLAVYLISCLRREVNPLMDPIAVYELSRLIERHRFNLVHTHNSKAGFIGRLAARRAQVPTVVHTVHGFAFHDEESAFRRALFRGLERLAAHWCDGMIFISRRLLDWAEREKIGPGIQRTVIFSGIDFETFRSADGKSFRRQWSIAPDRLVVGMVSKLWEGKGHAILLDAWKATLRNIRIVPEPLLLIVGEGHLEAALKKSVASLGLDTSVIFTGFQSDIPAATAAIDIAVLPSLFEGMGRVVLEAMASGKAVIASNVGGIPDLVRHGENGLLVPPGDRESLKHALVELLSDVSLRTRLSQNAYAGFRPEYGASYMVDQIHHFYQQLRTRR